MSDSEPDTEQRPHTQSPPQQSPDQSGSEQQGPTEGFWEQPTEPMERGFNPRQHVSEENRQ